MEVNWKILGVLLVLVLVGIGVYTCKYHQGWKVQQVRGLGGEAGVMLYLR